MSDVRSLALALVLENEGGHKPAGDPNDPGGDTWFGITRRTYPTLPWPPDIAEDQMLEQAKQIYALGSPSMWSVLRCEELPPRVAIVYLDMAVNHGGVNADFTVHGGTEEVPAAPRMLQRAIRRFDKNVVEDGFVGSATLRAANKIESKRLLRELCEVRLERYTEILTFKNYRHTWLTRALFCQQVGLLMAMPDV